MSKESLQSEFSHVVDVERVPTDGMSLRLSAGEAERQSLARRFRIPGVLALTAQVRIEPDLALAGGYRVSGRFEAEVEQTCVVSLEPVRQSVSESFERSFSPVAKMAPPASEAGEEAEWLDPEIADPPDPLVDGRIDIGEVVAEEVALALDPYPRKAGAGLPQGYSPDSDETARITPFAALARLKAEKKD